MELSLPFPGFSPPQPKKDSYQTSLLLNQLIYDFGQTGKQKSLEKSQKEYDLQSVQVEMYKVRQAVNDSYFSVLILQEKEKSLKLLEEDITNKLNSIKSKVVNGAALPSNQDILEAELIKIKQSAVENRSNKKVSLKILGELLNRTLDETIRLAKPADVVSVSKTMNRKRPEYASFELSKNRLNQTIALNNTKYLPRISGFGQLSYARPGLNYFNDKFQEYYIIGVKASWNFWNWNTNNREKDILRLQQKLIDTQEKYFTQNLNIAVTRHTSEMEKLEELIKMDQEIIALRKKITQQISSQLDNGVITSTEYLTELNAEHQAVLTLDIHKIQLLQAKVNYRTTIGE
jgi:outer membrane protein TolC